MQQREKPRYFIQPNQKLQDSLSFLEPQFKTLYSVLIQQNGFKHQLPSQLQKLCYNTFLLFHSQDIIRPSANLLDFSSFNDLLEDSINYLKLNSNKSKYLQCNAINRKDCILQYKTINFSKNILEASFFAQLYHYIQQKVLYYILCNYTIIINYKNQYIQVTGKPLNIDINLMADKQKERKMRNNKLDPYQIQVRRSLIFYCSHTNRTSGLFHRNIFFDQGLIFSKTKEQLIIVTTRSFKQIQAKLKNIKSVYLEKLYVHFQQLFNNVRNLFALRLYKNKKRSQFECLLKNYCPLPEDYKKIKTKVYNTIKKQQKSCQLLFDELYSKCSSYNNVTRLIRALLTKVVPKQLLGENNLQLLKIMMKQFVQMKRYQNFRMEDYLRQMNKIQIPWLEIKYNKKWRSQIYHRSNIVLGNLISFILNQIVIPVIKFNFYVTQQHKEANKIFYFRKPIWILVSKLALYKFSEQNLMKLTKNEAQTKRQTSEHYPEGKLRILPKKGTFRPIITFNKKMRVQKNSHIRQTLQRILANTQLVLRDMKNNLWQQLGFSVFDNRQIKKKFDDFVINWRKEGCPKLAYFTLDIKKCYDSIDTNKLLNIIKTTDFIKNFYFIKKYHRLYRNKRPLIGPRPFNSYFNMKQRIAASQISKDPLLINENDSIPSITIFSTRQKCITRQKVIQNLSQLCKGSIINYKNQMWSQNYGIPQGLNVSGVLCSLYFGTLQNKFIRKYLKKGLLMRLTDDYLYIGYQQQARTVLSALMKCAKQNSFEFSASKMSKNFYHNDFPHYDQKQYINWIGKRININTLQMQPQFEKNDKIQYAMNVNLKKQKLKGFMNNKLKSLLTNHFQSYFKPELFQIQSNLRIIRLFVQISLEKYHPFLKRYFILKTKNPKIQLLQILECTLHDFIIYICMLMKKSTKQNYLFIKKYVFEEVIQFFNKRKTQSQFRVIRIAFERKLMKLKQKLNIKQRDDKNEEIQIQ